MKNIFESGPPIKIIEPAVILRISKKYKESLSPQALYEITRGEWVIGKRREQAKYAFAVYQGVVVEVYKISRWLPFTGRTPSSRQRWYFEGEVAENLAHYKGAV